MRNKKSTSFRLSLLALYIIERLGQNLGLSDAAVLELALRRLAKLEGFDLEDLQKEVDMKKGENSEQ